MANIMRLACGSVIRSAVARAPPARSRQSFASVGSLGATSPAAGTRRSYRGTGGFAVPACSGIGDGALSGSWANNKTKLVNPMPTTSTSQSTASSPRNVTLLTGTAVSPSPKILGDSWTRQKTGVQRRSSCPPLADTSRGTIMPLCFRMGKQHDLGAGS
jgi:hypothetical protein